MKRAKHVFFTGIVGLLLIGAALLAAPPVEAIQISNDLGLSNVAGKSGLQTQQSVPQLVGRVIGTALSMLAVVFFILTIYGGFLWMTAHGKSDQVDKAKNTIIAAVIGVVIVMGSYAITQFVFDSIEVGSGSESDGNEVQQFDSTRCIAAQGDDFSCKQIQTCSGLQAFITAGRAAGNDPSVDELRAQCVGPDEDENARSCFRNLCPGLPNDVICCS